MSVNIKRLNCYQELIKEELPQFCDNSLLLYGKVHLGCVIFTVALENKVQEEGEVIMKKKYWTKIASIFMCIVIATICVYPMGKMGIWAASKEDIRLEGIDVSYHQGSINWSKVKAAGIDYAILRCGFGQDLVNQDDSMWEKNADACTELGIPFGAYLYSYATTEAKAVGEAKHVLRLIENYDLQYPVYYDIEDASQKKLGKEKLGKIAKAFADVIEDAGYEVGIYASYSWFNSYLTADVFDNYSRWVARYNTYCGYEKDYHMWQYSSSGKVNGVSGNVDMDYLVGTNVACEVAEVELNQEKYSLKVGESTELEAQVLPKNAFEKEIIWTTDANNVVRVEDGTVTALAEGTATVKATSKESKDIYATCKVTVSRENDLPQITSSPAITQTPTVTSSPAIDDKNTVEPTMEVPATIAPEPTTGSVVTSVPTPEQTTTMPSATVPVVTPTPTVTPVVTIVQTKMPQATATSTKTPQTTATAVPTKMPQATTVPTKMPQATATTAPTKTPQITSTVTPTKVPTVSVANVKRFTYRAITNKKLKLSWKKVNGVSGYRVYYYNTITKKYATLKTISSKKNSIEITDLAGKKLKPGTVYKFKIAAYKTVSGKKVFGEKAGLETVTKPDSIKIKSISRKTSTKATVKWNVVNNGEGYAIYLSTSPKSGYKEVAAIRNKTKATYTISGLKKGKAYYIRISAYKKLNGKTWYGNYGTTKKINKK